MRRAFRLKSRGALFFINSTNSSNSICQKGYPKPSSYSDSIYKLGDYGLIPKEFSLKFVYIDGIRNFLAHDYQKNTIPELEKFLKYGLNGLKKFTRAVEALL